MYSNGGGIGLLYEFIKSFFLILEIQGRGKQVKYLPQTFIEKGLLLLQPS